MGSHTFVLTSCPTNMVDAAGTTQYGYAAGGQLWTEDGPWASDTVTNSYTSRLRTGLNLAAAVLFLAVGLASVLSGCKRHDTVVKTAKSAAGNSASIVAYKDSVLGTYSADLVLRSADGQVVLRTNLIQSRDSIEDIPIEFFSLEIKSNVVHIGTKAVHYRGATEFQFGPAVPHKR